MWLMLQQEAPCDLVFGAGATHSVQEFVEEDFGYVKLDWREYVTENPRYLRPTEVSLLRADPSEAKRWLGWEPVVTFRDLVRIMMDADLEAASLPAPGQGKRCLTDSGWRGSGSRDGGYATGVARLFLRSAVRLDYDAGITPCIGSCQVDPDRATLAQPPRSAYRRRHRWQCSMSSVSFCGRMLLQRQREADRGFDCAEFFRSQRRDMLPQACLGDGEDRIEVHDTRLRKTIRKAERDLDRDMTDAGRNGGNRDQSPDRIRLIPGEQDDRSAAGWRGKVRPPDFTASHDQGSCVSTAALS